MSLEGQQLGEFEILERLGQGGMGAVYKARQTTLRRTVALKTLQAALADDVEYIARFQQEAVAAAGLNHPNLVQVHSAGESEGLHWFAMEYVEGESTKARLKRKGRLNPLEAIAIALHVATALEYGWRKAALIHRDIKPDNIFLSEDGEVKLGDLGLAKTSGQTQGLTMTGASMGTPHYISPEQVEAMKDVDLRADIYSLGCTLYHMLSGQPPFEGNSAVAIMMKHITSPVPNLQVAWPECPQVLADVVGKMMGKQPSERQQSYSEVISELRHAYDVVSGADSSTPAAQTARPEGKARTATDVQPQVLATPLSAAATKSKMALYLWLGMGILLFAAVALFIRQSREQKLTNGKTSPKEDTGNSNGSKPTEPWEDWLAQSRKTNGLLKEHKLQSGATGLCDDDGVRVRAGSDFTLVLASVPKFKDGAIRVLWTMKANGEPSLQLRSVRTEKNDPVLAYELRFAKSTIKLSLLDSVANSLRIIRQWDYPPQFERAAEHIYEFRAVGDLLTVAIDDQQIGWVIDESIQQAGLANVGLAKGMTLRELKTLRLNTSDVTASQQSKGIPSAAITDQPFVNTLGMKFIPVPGTKVLFGIWDTRVRDYTAYAGAKKVDDTWTKQQKDGVPVSREPENPVTGVSWEDAQGFCQWLTEEESAAGRLPKGAKYRLPTDEEWSRAVGLPSEIGATPAEKDRKNNEDFPWGKDYPLTKKVGNYADESFHAKFPPREDSNDLWDKNPWIEGYDDGYATTSPVGSFPANAYGLYDMGGNVSQWCEDWFDPSQKDRVLRGASWVAVGRGSLLSSYRLHFVPGVRFNLLGFRIRGALQIPFPVSPDLRGSPVSAVLL